LNRPCPDPPHGKPCYCVVEGEGYERLPSGTRIRIQPVSRVDELGKADWDSLELEADDAPPAPFGELRQAGFFLRLPCVESGRNDDIATVEAWLEWAAASGCARVLCPAPLLQDKDYRHRWLTLVRGLCDEYGLQFAILERPETPAAWHLNRFLASKKACCREPW
jgi:hypothetical protein